MAGLGTSGTFIGVGRRLREFNRKIYLASVQPDSPLHGLEGLKHMESSIVPGIFHGEELDRKIPVATDEAYEMVYRLGREEGLVVGQSSGAAMVAALKIAHEVDEATIVTLFPDPLSPTRQSVLPRSSEKLTSRAAWRMWVRR